MKKSTLTVNEDIERSVKLAIYLIKKEVKEYRECLKEKALYEEYDLKKSLGVEGKVLIGKNKKSEPEWKAFIEGGIEGNLPKLQNASNRALAFFKIRGRWIVIPFGYGKHLLKDGVIDNDFGLKTALNMMDPASILSIDRANIGELTVQTRTQSSRRSAPETFGIDPIRDLLTSVSGGTNIAVPQKYGKVISGNEAMYISPKIHFQDIPELLKILVSNYGKKNYTARFDWIDNLRVERDAVIIENLQEQVSALLMRKDSSQVHLAPPFLINWESFESISYSPKGMEYQDFDVNDLYIEKEARLTDLTWERLKEWRLYIKNSGMSEKTIIPLWRFLNIHLELNGYHYVFTLSNWYRIDRGYYDQIKTYCMKIRESELMFLDARKGESEGDYNIRLASSINGAVCMDKKLVRSEMSRSEIEACDVLTSDGEFLHVKHRNSSASLSHLFAQGRVSASLMRRDKVYRKNLRARIKSEGISSDIVPLDERDYSPSRYKITFVMLSKNARGFVDDLPFFSLVNFRLVAEELITLGYEVRVKNVLVK